MAALLEKYRKVAGTGPGSTINLDDWNGLIDELSTTLAGLVKKGADFDAVATVAIGVLLDRINNVLGPAYDQVSARGAQIEALYAQISGTGISANSVIESATRLFLTDARRAAILAELRGGVPSDGDTLMELYTAIQGALAAIQAIPSDVVRYGSAQALAAVSRRQAKVNLRTPESDYAYLTAAKTLDASSDGTLVLVDGDVTITLPAGSTFPYGGCITFRSVNGFPFNVAVQGSDTISLSAPSASSFRVYPGADVRLYWTGYQWNGAFLAPASAALLGDRSQAFTDAQKLQLLTNAGLLIPHCQGRLVWVSATQVRYDAFNGNQAFINGVYRTIPSAGPVLSNAGMQPNTVYNVNLAYSAGALILQYTGLDRAVGSYGEPIIAGYPNAAYVGKVYTDANGQFVDLPSKRWVLNHFNKRPRALIGAYVSAGTSSQSTVELSTAARVSFLIEGGDSVQGIASGTAGAGASSPGYNLQVTVSLDGADNAPPNMGGNAAYGDNAVASAYAWEPAEGLHYLTAKGATNGNYTASFRGSVSGMVMC